MRPPSRIPRGKPTAPMRPTRDLQRLQRSGLARTARLHDHMSSVLTVRGTARPTQIDSSVAFVIIELDNLWAGVARSLYLSAAFCAREGTGSRVQLAKATKARNTDEALTHAIRRCRPQRYKPGLNGPWTWRDEPLWWKPPTLLDALDAIGASNYQQVSTAMSASAGVFSHLHTFRNFYAHRGKGTRSAIVDGLRDLQYPTTYSATRALISPLMLSGQTRPQPLVLDWLDEIRNTISLLV